MCIQNFLKLNCVLTISNMGRKVANFFPILSLMTELTLTLTKQMLLILQQRCTLNLGDRQLKQLKTQKIKYHIQQQLMLSTKSLDSHCLFAECEKYAPFMTKSDATFVRILRNSSKHSK